MELVEAAVRRHDGGKPVEPARDQHRTGARSGHGADQGPGAGHRLDQRIDACQQGFGLAGQHGDAFPQGLGEVDLAAHAAPGDGGDGLAQARKRGKLVDEFAGDDGQFHVGQEETLAPAGTRLDREVDRGAGETLANGGFDRRRIATGKADIAGDPGCEPVGIGDRRAGLPQQGCRRRGDFGKRAADQGQDMGRIERRNRGHGMHRVIEIDDFGPTRKEFDQDQTPDPPFVL